MDTLLMNGENSKKKEDKMKSNKNLKVFPMPMSNEQWEVNVEPCDYNNPDEPMTCWVPTPGKDRPTPHKKINECDH
jgi:hypothetical protein